MTALIIENSINKLGGQPILILILFLVLVLLIWSLYNYLWSSHVDKRRRKMIKRLQIIFSIPISNKIKNLKVISRHSEDYKKGYELFSKQYEELTKKEFRNLRNMVDHINQFRKKRKYKNVSEEINRILPLIEVAEIKANKLDLELNKTREVEWLQRKDIQRLKENWAEFKKGYNGKRLLLDDYHKQLEKVVMSISNKFKIIDEYINKGNYDGSRKLIIQLENQLIEFGKAIEYIPDIITICNAILPDKIKKHKDNIKRAGQSGIKFNTLKLNDRLKFIENTLKDVFESLDSEDINGAVEITNGLVKEESVLAGLIESEQLAYHSFNENYPLTMKEFEDLITFFNGIEPQLKKQINNEKIIEKDVEIIAKLKSELSKLHTIVKKFTTEVNHHRDTYSYIDHLKGLRYLINKIQSSKTSMKKAIIILENITILIDKFNNEFRTISLALIQVETILLETKYKIEQENNLKQVVLCKERLDNIKKTSETNNAPIEDLVREISMIKDDVSFLVKAVNESVKTAEMAEKMYVFASRFSTLSPTCERQIATAEVEFKRGNYSKCLALSTNIMEKAENQIGFRMPEAKNDE